MKKFKIIFTIISLSCAGNLYANEFTPHAISQLDDINNFFKQSYSEARSSEIEKSGPVIITGGDQVKLYRNGKLQTTVQMDLTQYNALKSLSHIPLSLFAISKEQVNQDEIDEKTISKFHELHEKLVKLESTLGKDYFATHGDQKNIVKESLDFINKITKQKKISSHDINGYIKPLIGTIDSYIHQSVKNQYEQLNSAMSQLKAHKHLSKSEIDALRVIVMGPLQPRDSHIVPRFFKNFLKLNDEDRGRLLYSEHIYDDQESLKLLGTILLDRKIGMQFFEDPTIMEADLLNRAFDKHDCAKELDELALQEEQRLRDMICPFLKKMKDLPPLPIKKSAIMD